MGRRNRAAQRPRCSRSSAGAFWLAAGVGLALSAAGVVIAAEFTYLRRKRLLETGLLHLSEDELVQDLSEAVHEGLGVLSSAAHQLGQSFAEARRELVRFGLSESYGGGAADAWYQDENGESLRNKPGKGRRGPTGEDLAVWNDETA